MLKERRLLFFDSQSQRLFYGMSGELHFESPATCIRPNLFLVGTRLAQRCWIVDTPENLKRLIPEIEEMMDTGMIAASDVEYVRIEKPPPAGSYI